MTKRIELIFILLLSFATAKAQLGISASPMKLDFNAQHGATQSFVVTISNPSAKTLELSVDINDWERDEGGNIICSPANTLPTSCANWIKVFPSTSFKLEALEKKEITILLNVPDSNAATLKNSMVFFTQTNPEKGTRNGISVNLAVRIGVQVFYTPPGVSAKDIEITAFQDSTLNKSNIGKVLLLTLQNTGKIEIDGKVGFELTNMLTGGKTKLPDADFYTLPGAVRTIRVPLSPELKAGKYSVTALVDYGQDEELKIGELDFEN